MLRRSGDRHKVAVRWLGAFVWTTLVVVLLLLPGKTRVTPEHSVSVTWTGKEDMIESLGHVVLFGVLTALWQWTLLRHVPRSRALLLPVCLAVFLGIVTEIGQYFMVTRGASVLDLLANLVGVALPTILFYSMPNLIPGDPERRGDFHDS